MAAGPTPSFEAHAQCFVLFDPAGEPARLYRHPLEHLLAQDEAHAATLPHWIEQQLGRGHELALFAGFGAADALASLRVRQHPRSPRIEALAFAQAETLRDDAAVDDWLERGTVDHAPCGLARWRGAVTRQDYETALQRILELIGSGDTYQVNHTFALYARAFGDPLALYRALRRAQPTAYRALARLHGRWVLSLSPERFFGLDGRGLLQVRPMKGTAPRHADPQRDREAALFLRNDPKNRAENLMILDLLRNDLGRLAQPGSVRVPQRFAVEPYATVWQMTSAVQARLRDEVGWSELWRALFPCGSVVGAPKHRTMQIIAELEPEGRGLYTGAIGWLRPGAGTTPAATHGEFSVAIRTLEVDAALRGGTRAARLGVGGGVVADSTAHGEWDECWLKARFATTLDPGFGLIETFAAHHPSQHDRIDAHLHRLERSARYFGFRFERTELLLALQREHAALAPPCAGAQTAWSHRTRIELRHDGSFEIRCAPLQAPPARVEVLLAEQWLDDAVLDRRDPLLRHKTTHRARYDLAWQAAERQGAFDALFFNQRDELCEGGRSSVFVQLDGRWWTPPLRCGLLPGVARARLLADPRLRAGERVLRREDVLRAQALMLSNAVRGALPARLRPQRAPTQNGTGLPMP